MSALEGILDRLRTEPSRTGSVILTVYGDAILPRGGEAAMADLLVLMRRLGATEGVVRTAVSRLTRDGWLHRHRAGRHSFYRLQPAREVEFRAAAPRIYQRPNPAWHGGLLLAWPDPGDGRRMLEEAGWALCAPGVLVAPDGVAQPDGLCLRATGTLPAMRALVDRAWPLQRIDAGYAQFTEVFGPLSGEAAALPPLDALAARMLLIHEHRRIALRDPALPAPMLPEAWHGAAAWRLCMELYTALAPASERWLDGVGNQSGPLPRGPDPVQRFSGGGSTPPAPASSPAPAGNPRRPRSGWR